MDELGLEPGQALRELERQILRQDPALAAPTFGADGVPETSAETVTLSSGRSRGGRRGAAALAAVALAAGTAWLLALLIGGGHGHRDALRATLRSPAVGVLDATTGSPRAALALPGVPGRLATGLGAVWSTAYDEDALLRVDPRREVVTQTVHVGHGPTGVAVAAGDVWVADNLDNSIARVDAATSDVVQRIPVGIGPTEVAAGAGRVWVSSTGAGTVSRIDPGSGELLGATRLGSAPGALAVGAGAAWVAERGAGVLARLDARTGRLLDEVHVGSGPAAVAIGRGGVWVANELDSTVSLIDPDRDAVTLTRAVSGTPAALAAAGRGVWVAARDAPFLTRVDASGSTRLVRLPSPPVALAPGAGGVLVGVQGAGADHRGATLVVRVSGPLFTSVDAHYCCDLPPNLRALSYDGLLSYSTAPGSVGALVPDLALQLPRLEPGSRAYTFHLRPGLRYWTGAPVRASDVRRGLERAASSNGVYAQHLAALPGALACHTRPQRCDLRRAVTADDHTRRITLHLRYPAPAILEELALPTTAPAPSRQGLTPRHRSLPDHALRPAARGRPRAQPVLPSLGASRPAARLPGPHRVADGRAAVGQRRRRARRSRRLLMGPAQPSPGQGHRAARARTVAPRAAARYRLPQSQHARAAVR